MPEVFKRTQLNFGGAMAADQGLMTLNGGLSPVLIQNLGLTYGQQVTRLYELGEAGQTANMYYVSGRAQGQATIARVIGPAVQLAAFYDKYGDACLAGSNYIGLALDTSCGDDTFGSIAGVSVGADLTDVSMGAGILLAYCVLTQVGIAVGAQDLIISENNQIMFSNMDYEGE